MTNRFRPWLCASCGYQMDAASAVYDKDATPSEGDIAMCLNCGAPQTFAADGTWRPASAAELAALPPETRADLRRAQRARALAGLPDLTREDGRT